MPKKKTKKKTAKKAKRKKLPESEPDPPGVEPSRVRVVMGLKLSPNFNSENFECEIERPVPAGRTPTDSLEKCKEELNRFFTSVYPDIYDQMNAVIEARNPRKSSGSGRSTGRGRGRRRA